MPRKSLKDGRIATVEEAEQISKRWDAHDVLRERGLGGQSLLQDQHGKKYVLPNLGNMSFNADVLWEIAQDMKRRSRLSSDPIEVLLPMTVAWYRRFAANFAQVPEFSVQVWAFRDAWALHKMFSKLRPKVLRGERPREPCLSLPGFFSYYTKMVMIIAKYLLMTSTLRIPVPSVFGKCFGTPWQPAKRPLAGAQ